MGSRTFRVLGALLIAALVLVVALSVPVTHQSPSSPASSRGVTPRADVSFTFGAVGDFAAPGNADMVALSKRLAAMDANFLLAMGDLGYVADEAGWCSSIKGGINDVLLIAGNHDTGESSGGNISEFVQYCPFTLDVPVIAGPGTPGYGYEYYFDYPAGTPLARIILTTAGVRGSTNYDYTPGSLHFNFVVDAVNDARANGIRWVIVGGHKPCINAHSYRCEFGQGLFDKLIELKVDLLLFAHTHTYQRSHQLALSDACPTIPSDGGFDADCIVDDGHDDHYEQGPGSIVVINGAGGRSLYDIGFGTDAELGYMAQALGSNGNTKGLLAGFGATVFTVSSAGINEKTDLCPAGTTDGEGQCASQLGSVFNDAFAIGDGAPPPPPPPPLPDFSLTASPASPGSVSFVVGQSAPLTITLQPTGNFTGIVSLTAASDPAGVSGFCAPSSITVGQTSTCTLSASTAGSYTVTIIGTSGTLVHTSAVAVTVNPVESGPDTTPPAITITSPSNESTLNTTSVTVTGSASDNVALQSVELSTDGTTWWPTTGQSSWSATVRIPLGSHNIYARATDTAGNRETDMITVVVGEEPSPPSKTPTAIPPETPFALGSLLIAAAAVAPAVVLVALLVIRSGLRSRKGGEADGIPEDEEPHAP